MSHVAPRVSASIGPLPGAADAGSPAKIDAARCTTSESETVTGTEPVVSTPRAALASAVDDAVTDSSGLRGAVSGMRPLAARVAQPAADSNIRTVIEA
jgi:hypothetical protein